MISHARHRERKKVDPKLDKKCFIYVKSRKGRKGKSRSQGKGLSKGLTSRDGSFKKGVYLFLNAKRDIARYD